MLWFDILCEEEEKVPPLFYIFVLSFLVTYDVMTL